MVDMLSHTGEKPYECDRCRVMYMYTSLLKSHVRKYIWKKPLKCDTCGARFTKNDNLPRHVRIRNTSNVICVASRFLVRVA